MKKIWIVTELFYPEETAVAFIFTRIANFLSKSYKVCVICGPEYYDKHKIKFTDNVELSPGIEIFRVRTFPFDKNSLVQRTLKLVHLSISMWLLMLRKISKGEEVLLATNPSFLLLFAKSIKLIRKIRLHILVHDVFPENTIPAGVFKNEESIVFKIIKFLFDWAYSSADHLIVIGRDMKYIISKKIDHVKIKPQISIIPNWTYPENFNLEPGPVNDGYFVLQYAGNIGRVQGLIEILDAFRKSHSKNVIINFRGTGAFFPEVKKYIEEYRPDNIFLKGGFSRNEEFDVLKNCDIGIVSLSKGMFGLGVPSKTYHLLSAGKPILYIGEPGTEIYCLVEENGIGWSLDISDEKNIISFFNDLCYVDRRLLVRMGERARLLAEKNYTEAIVLGLLKNEIESVHI